MSAEKVPETLKADGVTTSVITATAQNTAPVQPYWVSTKSKANGHIVFRYDKTLMKSSVSVQLVYDNDQKLNVGGMQPISIPPYAGVVCLSFTCSNLPTGTCCFHTVHVLMHVFNCHRIFSSRQGRNYSYHIGPNLTTDSQEQSPMAAAKTSDLALWRAELNDTKKFAELLQSADTMLLWEYIVSLPLNFVHVGTRGVFTRRECFALVHH